MRLKFTYMFALLATLLFLIACSSPQEAEPVVEEQPTEAPAEPTEAPAEPEEEPEPEPEASGDGSCADEAVLCVGLVTDVGRIDDKSFNQSAWEGVQLAESELGATIQFVETQDPTDYADNIALFADEDYDVIVTVGFALGEATLEAAAEYPDIDFVGVDQFQGEAVDNVAGLIFPEAKSGFLAGALAGMMTESGTIAAVLGTDLVPPVVAFKEGYEAGAKAVNPDINFISTYHPGGLDVAFIDPEWGAATARQAMDQGADVVFGAGGATGNGALIEVAGQEGAYCIGVDTDQWETVPEAQPCLISSAMKLITPGVLDLVAASQDGTMPAGNFLGAVGLAPYHDFASVIPADVQAVIEELDAGLATDDIPTDGSFIFEGAPLMSGAMADDGEMAEIAEGDCSDEAVLCVGLVTDVGRIDDKSFNQSAWEGVLAAQEAMGAQVKFVETQDPTDYADNIALFADDGYDVIVTVGFALGEATIEAAAEYPDIDFIGVDQFQGEAVPNIAGLIFPEDKSGFLAGALAAMMSETGTIGAVLGTDLVPPVVFFKEGYEAGARYIDPDINFISTYHPGGLDVAFIDPEWGAATARQALDQGADIIFGAGGATGNGALIEVANADGAYCIGVDTDQWETVPEAQPCLISSAMKLITPGVADLIALSADGIFPEGNFVGAVGLAPFHDFDSVIPDDVKQTLEEIDAGLKDGSIETGVGG